MLESVRACIDIKERIMKLVDDVEEEKLLWVEIKKRVEEVVLLYEGVRKFPILRVKKL